MNGTAFIAIGGNLGDVHKTMQQAVSLLNDSSDISNINCSGVYRTSPIGAKAGETFLNAVVSLQTSRSPVELLKFCHEIEHKMGRKREIHWGPRTIDLDVIAFDDHVIHCSEILLPHPACWYRRFVLDPFAEIAPDWQHPERKATMIELQTRLLNRPLILDLSDCHPNFIESATKILEDTFSRQEFVVIANKNHPKTDNATWKVLEHDSQKWEISNPVSRLNLHDLPSPTANSLADVVCSALEAPQRIAELLPVS